MFNNYKCLGINKLQSKLTKLEPNYHYNINYKQ